MTIDPMAARSDLGLIGDPAGDEPVREWVGGKLGVPDDGAGVIVQDLEHRRAPELEPRA
jgi:hypothetical protein